MKFQSGPAGFLSPFLIYKQMRAPHTQQQNREKAAQNFNAVQAHEGQRWRGRDGRIGILLAPASRYPNFDLETVDLEVLSGIRTHQNREKSMFPSPRLLFASGWRFIHQNLQTGPVTSPAPTWTSPSPAPPPESLPPFPPLPAGRQGQ